MRSAHLIPSLNIFLSELQRRACLIALTCSLCAGLSAHAQVDVYASPLTVVPVLNPEGSVRGLSAPSFSSSRAIADADGDWQAANAAVGRFSRGHIDIVNWEKDRALQAGPRAISFVPEGHERSHQQGEQP